MLLIKSGRLRHREGEARDRQRLGPGNGRGVGRHRVGHRAAAGYRSGPPAWKSNLRRSKPSRRSPSAPLRRRHSSRPSPAVPRSRGSGIGAVRRDRDANRSRLREAATAGIHRDGIGAGGHVRVRAELQRDRAATRSRQRYRRQTGGQALGGVPSARVTGALKPPLTVTAIEEVVLAPTASDGAAEPGVN